MFFDGFQNIHDKLHDDQDKVKASKNETEVEEVINDDQDHAGEDHPLIFKKNCETTFVTIESVHYTEVRNIFFTQKQFMIF